MTHTHRGVPRARVRFLEDLGRQHAADHTARASLRDGHRANEVLDIDARHDWAGVLCCVGGVCGGGKKGENLPEVIKC